MSARLIRIAALYLAIGVMMGIAMGVTQNFALAPVHAHINLLGWASLGIMGVVYRAYPDAERTLLARIHFWMHNLALPVFMVGLGCVLSGHDAFLPMTIAGALAVAIGVLIYVVNVWRCVRPAQSADPMARAVRATT